MREIKFRAWDKLRKEMRGIQLMDFSDWWVSTGDSWERKEPLTYGERNSFKNQETDRHILMQFTGLYDRNGVEIYEGDMLEFGSMGVVEFNGGSFVISIKDGFHYPITPEVKVLGNIYETEI